MPALTEQPEIIDGASEKFFFAAVKRIDAEARTLDAVASTSDLDRHGEVVLPEAFTRSLASFKANPVILAGHQHRLYTGSSPVIGSALPESIEVREKDVRFTMQFASTPLGEEYWTLYRDKHMRAFSIGFIPLEWQDARDEKLGDIRTYTKIELLEISAVPVPSNRRALVRAKGFYSQPDRDDDAVKAAVAEAVEKTIDRVLKLNNDILAAHVTAQCESITDMLFADRGGYADGAETEMLGDAERSAAPADEVTEQLKRINDKLNN